ncbi:MAG: hypothetical protein PUF72_07945 [Clostridiales bacterium]|nr:hypothetical protein [Clostridiales bacterium]
MKTTDELLKILNKTKNLDDYIDENLQSFIDTDLKAYLEKLLEEKDLKKSEVIQKANLSQIHAYKIFSGERRPGRDKLLCLCFGMGLGLKETQLALRLADHNPLYPRLRRDSVIIFAINEGASLMECNEALFDMGEDILE